MSEIRIPGDKKPGAETFAVEVEGDILDGIDAFAATHRDSPSRPETVRRILREWLCTHGFVRPPASSGGTRPEDLNAENDG